MTASTAVTMDNSAETSFSATAATTTNVPAPVPPNLEAAVDTTRESMAGYSCHRLPPVIARCVPACIPRAGYL